MKCQRQGMFAYCINMSCKKRNNHFPHKNCNKEEVKNDLYVTSFNSSKHKEKATFTSDCQIGSLSNTGNNSRNVKTGEKFAYLARFSQVWRHQQVR